MGFTVYLGGTFDLFHSGHVELLRKARKLAGLGGKVVVALNSDEFVQEFKNKAPVCSFAERRAVLDACRYVDMVVRNIGGADSKPTIDIVKPDFIMVGSDWAGRDYNKQMGFDDEWLRKNNIIVVYVDYTQGISSTDIRGRLQAVK